jgi:hypothetical protein
MITPSQVKLFSEDSSKQTGNLPHSAIPELLQLL